MSRIWRTLCSPGAKKECSFSAPTQPAAAQADDRGLSLAPKHRLLDRWLDAIVSVSGSSLVLIVVMLGLFTWCFLGIAYSKQSIWQISISDIQALLCYIFDSLLMRQQLNQYDEAIAVAAQLQSRGYSHLQMLEVIKAEIGSVQSVKSKEAESTATTTNSSIELPRDSLLGRALTRISVYYGHVVSIFIFWAAITIWLAFGPSNDWSNEWQLSMNSATSASMVFTFVFLANIREQHSTFSRRCIDATFDMDAMLERKLRQLARSDRDNCVVVIPPQRVNWLQRAICYYADVVGTLVGIAILIIVIVAWIAIGPLLSFNDNWWLIIGTYAGLIGLHDGFVLLNVQANLRSHEEEQLVQVESLDHRIVAAANAIASSAALAPFQPSETRLFEHSMSFRLSLKLSNLVGNVCGHPVAVILDLAFIVGLLVGSSVMGWNTTGQLLSNVPPGIVESFLMIVLLPGHNYAESKRRVQMQNFFAQRRDLVDFAGRLESKI